MSDYRIEDNFVYVIEPFGESFYDMLTHVRLSADKQPDTAQDTVTLTVSIYDYVGEPVPDNADVQLTINGKQQTLSVIEGVSSVTLTGHPYYEVTAEAEGRRGAALLVGSKPEPPKPPTVAELAAENQKLRQEIARQNEDFQSYMEFAMQEQAALKGQQAQMNKDLQELIESIAT
ncbi:hypothetical protein [Paenibacillus sp. GbtcB18]|uniref:hypothetical protein n=1 Tax=Paenibacillus sp. GbtcB18 TaxID=2824763 RepID=UPI001C2FF42F|nr:hypothetical protein [Paenibacillus sp. GbtcB18]